MRSDGDAFSELPRRRNAQRWVLCGCVTAVIGSALLWWVGWMEGWRAVLIACCSLMVAGILAVLLLDRRPALVVEAAGIALHLQPSLIRRKTLRYRWSEVLEVGAIGTAPSLEAYSVFGLNLRLPAGRLPAAPTFSIRTADGGLHCVQDPGDPTLFHNVHQVLVTHVNDRD